MNKLQKEIERKAEDKVNKIIELLDLYELYVRIDVDKEREQRVMPIEEIKAGKNQKELYDLFKTKYININTMKKKLIEKINKINKELKE